MCLLFSQIPVQKRIAVCARILLLYYYYYYYYYYLEGDIVHIDTLRITMLKTLHLIRLHRWPRLKLTPPLITDRCTPYTYMNYRVKGHLAILSDKVRSLVWYESANVYIWPCPDYRCAVRPHIWWRHRHCFNLGYVCMRVGEGVRVGGGVRVCVWVKCGQNAQHQHPSSYTQTKCGDTIFPNFMPKRVGHRVPVVGFLLGPFIK